MRPIRVQVRDAGSLNGGWVSLSDQAVPGPPYSLAIVDLYARSSDI